MQKIILIGGKAQNGKSQSSKLLKQKLESKGYDVCIIPFAKYLKIIMKDYYGWDGITKDEWFRTLAQNLGTDIIRQEMKKPLFHVSRVCEDIEIIKNSYDYILIDDLRYLNECYYPMAIFPNQVITVKIERTNFESPLTKQQQEHVSETELDNFDFDYTIVSESGIENLDKEINKFIKTFLFKSESYDTYVEEIKDLTINDIIEVTQILDPNDADHLTLFIGQIGTIYSYIKKSGKYKYKVLFQALFQDKTDEDKFETHYFFRDELKLIEKYNKSESEN